MKCKNCGSALRTDYSYCPNCGAKVIRNRITFKNLWFDIIERYFNLDNTFLKTFIHLFTKPEVVIEGYLNGIRRKYLNPVSYIAIALTLSGVSMFIMKKYAWDKFDFGGMTGGANQEVTRKIMEVTMDFNSFVFLLYVPIVALSGFAVFNKKSYLFSEHLVISLYIMAHYSIFSFFVAVPWLIWSPENYFSMAFLFIAIMAIFALYGYIRISRFSFGQTIWRSIVYFMIFGIGFLGIGILLNIIMFMTGVISLADFKPQ